MICHAYVCREKIKEGKVPGRTYFEWVAELSHSFGYHHLSSKINHRTRDWLEVHFCWPLYSPLPSIIPYHTGCLDTLSTNCLIPLFAYLNKPLNTSRSVSSIFWTKLPSLKRAKVPGLLSQRPRPKRFSRSRFCNPFTLLLARLVYSPDTHISQIHYLKA